MNGLVVILTFFNFSLNFAIRSSLSEPQSGPYLVFFWKGNGYRLEHSRLYNYKDREAWWAIVHGVAKTEELTLSLFNMLSRFVIAVLPRSKHLLISWLWSPSTVILETKKIKSVTVPTFSLSICHEVMGLDAMILVFWLLSIRPAFSLPCLKYIKRLFSFFNSCH